MDEIRNMILGIPIKHKARYNILGSTHFVNRYTPANIEICPIVVNTDDREYCCSAETIGLMRFSTVCKQNITTITHTSDVHSIAKSVFKALFQSTNGITIHDTTQTAKNIMAI
jgi:hypothetical protein